MLQADEKLEAALHARQLQQRDQRVRLRWIAATAASYAIDTVFLALFVWAGTIEPAVPAGYGAGAAMICLGTLVVTVRGWNAGSSTVQLAISFQS